MWLRWATRGPWAFCFIYKSPWCFIPRFESTGLSVQERKWKLDFQDLAFPIGTILATFDLQVTLIMLMTQFSRPFGSGEEAKKQISRWPPWRPSWNYLAIFDLQVISMLPNITRFESIGLSVQEKKRKIDFQDGRHGFPIGTILAVFDLQVTPMLHNKFRVNWSFGSEMRPSQIFDQSNFSFFFIYKSPPCFLPSFESIGFLVQEKQKIDFRSERF